MIPYQVHCLLDCMQYLMRSLKPELDFRPMYFGAWSVPVHFDRQGELTYYSRDSGFADEFNALFGISVTNWIEHSGDRKHNYRRLEAYANSRSKDSGIVTVVDLYHLNYPNRCYRTRHRPHIVIVESASPEEWRLIDPYHSWQGVVPASDMAEAFGFEDLQMGLLFHSAALVPPSLSSASAKLTASLAAGDELTDYLIHCLSEAGESSAAMEQAAARLGQIGVLGKRKNAYRYALSFLSDGSSRSIENAASLLEALMNGWGSLGFLAAKLGVTLDGKDLIKLQQRVAELKDAEAALLRQLRSMLEAKEALPE